MGRRAEKVALQESISLVLGIWGSVLGTYGAWRAHKLYRQQQRDRIPDVRVSVQEMVSLQPIPMGTGGLETDVVAVTIRNHGLVRVTLNFLWFRPEDGKHNWAVLQPVGVGLPHDLEAGKACTLSASSRHLKETARGAGYAGAIRLRAHLSDAIGREWKSELIEFDVTEGAPERPGG